MKRALFAFALVAVLAMGCTNDDDGDEAGADAGTAGAGGVAMTGGESGAGGDQGGTMTGGTPAPGGTMTGGAMVGGEPSGGGVPGAGGAPSMGGTPTPGGAPASDAGLPDMMPSPTDMGAEPCTAAGELMEAFPCCEGAMPVPCSAFERNECIPCNELPRCLPCGNGVCDEGENVCNCGADCEFDVACFEAGQTLPNVEGAPGCCEGLVVIGCEQAAPPGLCRPCEGSTSCSPCGDGVCDPVENNCNCADDCEPIPRCQGSAECRDGGATDPSGT